jgi:hsp70-interacting protein
MKYQDGISSEPTPPQQMAEADRQWLEEAMKEAMVDLNKRMQDIKSTLDQAALETSTSTTSSDAQQEQEQRQQQQRVEDYERLLDELVEIVESIDYARDLATIGGLSTLLDLLSLSSTPHPSLRWKSAEVIATCVQNNPAVQHSFMEGGVLPPLLSLLSDPHPTCRTKSLLALSCMIRGHPPAQLWLRQHNFIPNLIQLLSLPDQDPRPRRKCLRIIESWLLSSPTDAPTFVQAGLLPHLAAALNRGDDSDTREAGLAAATALASIQSVWDVVREDVELKNALDVLMVRLDMLEDTEDWEAAREEVEMGKKLQETLATGPPQNINDTNDTHNNNMQIMSV